MMLGLLQSDDILAQKLGASGSTPVYSPLIGQDIETIFSTPKMNANRGFSLSPLDIERYEARQLCMKIVVILTCLSIPSSL